MKIAERRKKTEKEISENFELTELIRYKEERIKALLNPVESYILIFQRILVWDLPYASVVLYLAIHILFWLSTTIRIYCLFGVTCLVLVAVDFGILHVLAKTDGHDEPDSAAQNSWTDVHPDFLGVPEISYYVAKLWVNGLGLLDSAIAMRASNHPRFFVSSIVYLGVLAFFGTYIPGVYLAYVIVMGLLLWPCLKYHRFFDRVESVALPLMNQLEQKLNIKRKRRRRTKKGARTRQDLDDEQSSDEQTLNEFVPPMSPVVMTTLNSALSNELAWDEEEEDDDLLSLTDHNLSGRATPQMPSFSQWRDQSDDEILGDDLSPLTHGLGTEMPSINDVDGTFLEVEGMSMELEAAIVENILSDDHCSAISPLQSPPNASGESDTDADEESLATGLCFSDADSADVTGTGSAPVFGGTLLNDILTQGHSTLSAALSSSTLSLSGIVSGASLGIGALRDAVKRGALAASSSVEEVVTDSDVLDAEFEFLDHEEFE